MPVAEDDEATLTMMPVAEDDEATLAMMPVAEDDEATLAMMPVAEDNEATLAMMPVAEDDATSSSSLLGVVVAAPIPQCTFRQSTLDIAFSKNNGSAHKKQKIHT
jgi:hypothetical protein